MAVGKMQPMTYPKSAVPLSAEQRAGVDFDGQHGDLWEIPIDLIDIDTVENHRVIRDEAAIRELAESIEQHGLQQPVRVYHNGATTAKDVRFTLGFGFRRVAAHRALQRSTIRAFVLPPADEQQIRVAQAIENLHRADLHPLEEAQACDALLGSTDGDVAQAAAMIGRPRSWVENRLALTRLSPRVRQMFLDGVLYLGHAQVIAQLPGFEDQEEIAGYAAARKVHRHAWKAVTVKGDMHPPEAVVEVRKRVRDKMRELANVPWKLDAEFAGKVACSACPENTANAPGLFDGDQPRKALCLNRACFVAKTRAASSAVTKASNTLVKMKVSATPAKAKKAIAERAVPFVRPAAVANAAKRKKTPKKKTRSESRGVRQASKKEQAQWDFERALRKWNEDRVNDICAAVKPSPWTVAAIALLIGTTSFAESTRWGWTAAHKKKRAAAAGRVNELVPSVIAVGDADDQPAALADLAHELIESGELTDVETLDRFSQMDEACVERVAHLMLKADAIPPKPTLAQFQEKQEPKPAAKKSASKKKSRGRKKKTTTRRAAAGAAW